MEAIRFMFDLSTPSRQRRLPQSVWKATCGSEPPAPFADHEDAILASADRTLQTTSMRCQSSYHPRIDGPKPKAMTGTPITRKRTATALRRSLRIRARLLGTRWLRPTRGLAQECSREDSILGAEQSSSARQALLPLPITLLRKVFLRLALKASPPGRAISVTTLSLPAPFRTFLATHARDAMSNEGRKTPFRH